MRQNLERMSQEGVDLPVMLSGAALTRDYVEQDCAEAYGCGTGRLCDATPSTACR